MIGPKAIIHLNRLIANYSQIKLKFPSKQIMAVVKANGYGHGGVACALELEKNGCDSFAVFSIYEGLELRKAGIKSDILVFSRIDFSLFHEAEKNNLTLNICNISDINSIENLIKNTKSKINFHLKIDTGMTRLGISMGQLDDVLKMLIDRPFIKCIGIFSHFSTADEGDLAYARKQEDLFLKALEKSADFGYKFENIHFSNSGAILNLKNSFSNCIRAGMLLYGALPSSGVPMNLKLEPVMEFRAPIVELRRVPRNTSVSYGGVYKTKKETNIGVIQCGFADGLQRRWYQNGYISYNGKKYKIAGRICMDQFMVDFNDVEPVIGDEVIIFGKNNKDNIKIEEIAESISSTPYVLTTALNGRTRRIYKN